MKANSEITLLVVTPVPEDVSGFLDGGDVGSDAIEGLDVTDETDAVVG